MILVFCLENNKCNKKTPTPKINSKTTLVVTSLYDKKYDLNDMVINYESYEEILEAIDEFMNKFNMKNCFLNVNFR